ncbi:NAD(P)-binding oxidoreductase [Actinoplanes sp. NPDC048791]|uniref:NAD(P)-dependent oxidoreductase n=1 Tax=Actinoplanes sp. NPDC048791 TaxID=3154623 RepID=UPI0033D8496F
MKITVFGATGGTGVELVRQALEAGHAVTAVVRSAADFPAGVEVVRADVMDPAAIEPAVAGRDVVISALGHRPGAHEPVCAPAAESIIQAMRAAGVRRLVVVTAAGHIKDSHDGFVTARILKPLLWWFLRAAWTDFVATDRIVAASGLDWTIMRPPRLTDGGARPYRTALDHTVRGGSSISRTDLATATLAAATDPATVGHAVALGY